MAIKSGLLSDLQLKQWMAHNTR